MNPNVSPGLVTLNSDTQPAGQVGAEPHEPADEHRVLDPVVAVGHVAHVQPLGPPERNDVGVAGVGVLLRADPVAIGAG